MSSRDQYVRKMQAKLDEWNADIETLSTRGGKVAADIKGEYGQHIESLKVKRAAAAVKLGELRLAGESAWVDLKSGTEAAWAAMGKAVDAAKARFS